MMIWTFDKFDDPIYTYTKWKATKYLLTSGANFCRQLFSVVDPKLEFSLVMKKIHIKYLSLDNNCSR